MGRRLTPVAGVLAVMGLAACGGPMTNDELQRGIESLGATAAEGRIVALDVVEDRTKVTFVRVHARDLGESAQHEAEKLHDAQPRRGNEAIQSDAVKLASEIASALSDLQTSPANRVVARQVEERLDALDKQADLLTSKL